MTVSENEEAIYKQLNKNRLRLYATLSKKINSDTDDFFYKNDGYNLYYPNLESLNEYTVWKSCAVPNFRNEGNGVVSFLGAVFKEGWENTETWEMVADIKFGYLKKTGLILLTDANNPFPRDGWDSESHGRWGISAWERFIGEPNVLNGTAHFTPTYEGDSQKFTTFNTSANLSYTQKWHSLHMKKVSPTRLIVWLDDNETDRLIYDWEELSDVEQVTFGATMNHSIHDYAAYMTDYRLYVRDFYVFYPELPPNKLTTLCEDTKKIKCSTNNTTTLPSTPNLANGNTLAINEFNIHNKIQYCNNVLRYTLRKCGIDFTDEETNELSNKMNKLITCTNEILTTPTIDVDDIYSAYVNSNDNILFSDSGFENTSSLENKWILKSAVTRSVGDNGTTLSIKEATTSTYYQTAQNSISGDWEAIVHIENQSNISVRFGFLSGSTRQYLLYTPKGEYFMKLVRENGVTSGYISSDGVTWTSKNMSGTEPSSDEVYLYIGQYNTSTTPTSFTYKDLKVYKKGTVFTDNKTKELTTVSNANIIFKKGDYIHTYLVIKTSGIPNKATLYLLDENSNQLYSPYDINGNQVKSPCFIISGETNALQLPANYNGNQYTDFVAGTYNWKLKYNEGGNTFTDKIIPITVEICDFDLETNLTPEIYPNEDIQVQLKTYVDTPISLKEFDNDRLTTNASYNNNTGIITYPNSDINDLSVGEHTQTINQIKNYNLNYIIKNPIFCSINYNETNPYSKYRTVGARIESDCSLNLSDNKNNTIIIVNNTRYVATDRLISADMRYDYIMKRFPPGTYSCSVTTVLSDGQTYNALGNFIIPITNCSLSLEQNQSNVLVTYIYNNEIPIPNASIQILKNNNVIDTLITDSNGQCTTTKEENVTYKAQVIDYDGTVLLESNILS